MPLFSGIAADNIPSGLRLDRYVADELRLMSRSALKSRRPQILLNGKPVKLSRSIKPGDLVEISWNENEPLNLIPENIPLDIVYEDMRMVVINKPGGLVVHPGAGNRRGTLANALLYRVQQRFAENPFSGSLRPGIVHRLDKDTSGLIAAAYDDEALAFLSGQFKARKVRKIYAAIVEGCPDDLQGTIDKCIVRDSRDRKRFTVADPAALKAGKTALTHYRVIRSWGGCSLLALSPKTGRTHQLRVHLRFLGHPILYDPVYGFRNSRYPAVPGAALMLHSKSLTLVPPGAEEAVTFTSPLPDRFRFFIDKRK
ncbi:putative RNA pseudouridine synthase [Spirochaetia bacterium]|nr:putative RNA pseudouridine synthase [Spirochaetia bacterium]